MDLTLASVPWTGLLRRAFAEASVGMSVSTWTPGGEIRMLEVNRALAEMTGHSREELLAAHDPLALMLHPDDLQEAREQAWRVVNGELSGYEVERRFLRPDGTIRWVLLHATVLAPEGDGPFVSFNLLTDITPQKEAEAALCHSQAQLQQIIDSTPALVYVKDLAGRFLLVNRAFLELAGRDQDDVLGRSDEELWGPEGGEIARRNDRRALAADGPVTVDEVSPDGSLAFMSVKFKLRDDAGRPYAVAGVSFDIRERLEAERALRRSQARLAEAHAIAGIGIWEWYPDEEWGYWSDELYRILGLAPQSVPASYTQLLALIHPLDRGRAEAELQRTVADGAPLALETRIVTPAGDVRTVQLRGRVVGDDPRRRFSGVLQDTTELTSARRELERIRARNELILDSAGEGICGVDPVGRITFVNRTGAAMLGWPQEELVGKPFHQTLQHSRRDESARPAHESAVLATIRTGNPSHRDEEPMWRRDGTCFPSACTCVALEDRGRIVGAVVTFADISERLRAREADRLDSIARLAAGAAHEFNNQLSVIMSYASLLEAALADSGNLSAEAAEITKAAGHAADLTHRLLLFGRQELTPPEPLDLSAVVREMTPLLRRLAGEGIDLRLVLDERLPPVLLARPRAEELLINLAVNARDAMPAGGALTIATAVIEAPPTEVAARPPQVRLTVRDTGPGIEPEVARRAFEPFFTTKPRGRGTGLGLATVHGVVTEAGGRVSIGPMRGGGTVVDVMLPATAAPPPPVPADLPPEPPLVARPATVLLVEDRPPLRRLLARALTDDGHVVLTAGAAAEGIMRARRHGDAIDVLVTDLVLPGMSGRELHGRLAAEQPGLRAIYMTGHAPELADGAPEDVLLLAKPFEPRRLADAVAQVLA